MENNGYCRLKEYIKKEVLKILQEHKEGTNKEIIPFRIEDFWELSSLTKEQIQSLNTDLSVFVYGNGYGEAMQYINGELVIRESAENRTHTFEEVKKELKTKLNFQDWQIKEQQGSNNIKLILLFSIISQNPQIVVSEMETLGWSKSYMTPQAIIRGIPIVAISFDPLYQPSIKSTVRQWKYILHLSPWYNKDSILKNGLIPSSKNSFFKYPPRLYLLKPTIPQMELHRIGKRLSETNTNPSNNGDYCLFQINLDNVPEDTDFYFDPRYKYGIYTRQTIQTDAITYLYTINMR
jgi:hypothetical protein